MDENSLWLQLSNEVNIATLKALKEQERMKRDANIEVEIQFGTYLEPDNEEDNGRFISTVSPAAFFRVLNYFKKLTPPTVTEVEDQLYKNERISYNRKTKETEYYDKNRIYSSYEFVYNKNEDRFENESSEAGIKLASEYNMKITVANEYSYQKQSKDFRSSKIRLKKRSSFNFKQQYGGYLDLTIVDETYWDRETQEEKTKIKYEVEFEITEQFDTFRTKIEKFSLLIISLLQDSVIPYTNSEKIKMYKYVGGVLDTNYKNLKFSMLPEARDLRIKDMVYGGIVGNSTTPYCVTHKADGVRKLIVTTPDSIWGFVPGTQDANLIFKFLETDENNIAPFLEGFIFDGELLTKESRKDNHTCRYMFYIFDCLCENKQDIRNKNYMERMELALKFTEYPFIEINSIFVDENESRVSFREFQMKDYKINQVIKFAVKGYLSLVSVEHFFETMRLMFLQQNDLLFKQDGFMFIPLNTCYNPYDEISPLPLSYTDALMFRNAPSIFYRSLLSYPDICKWKPVELRSIDFIVEKKGKQVQLKAIEGNNLKIFDGTQSYPLSNRIDIEHPIVQNLVPNSIVEFYWDAKRQLLTPTRIRTDKPQPNKLQTANIIWKNIFKGIDQETLIGESFQLMREYHNQIKNKLYKDSKDTRNNKVLLDIGTGRGEYINKWSDFDLIFAVEPNPKYQKELLSRLKTSKIDSTKVILIPTKGEDYETITKTIQKRYGEKVSTVSFMLSLSYFYDEARNGIRKTIEDNLDVGGEVLIFTIDGDTVEEVFVPSSGEYEEKTLKFLNADLTYDPNSGNLYIDIPGTIVPKQKERPPKLSELFIEWDNFLPLHISRSDKQPFLNSGEKPFSNMYTSFTMIYLSNSIYEIEIEQIVPYEKIPLEIDGEKDYGPVEDWTHIKNGFYGISVFPSDYFFLSAVLKAIDPEYQNNNNFEFRREYVIKIWKEIYNRLSPSDKQIYQTPWTFNVLKIFADIFGISILYVKDKLSYRFGGMNVNKVVLVDSFLLGRMNERRQLQTLFSPSHTTANLRSGRGMGAGMGENLS